MPGLCIQQLREISDALRPPTKRYEQVGVLDSGRMTSKQRPVEVMLVNRPLSKYTN